MYKNLYEVIVHYKYYVIKFLKKICNFLFIDFQAL